MGETLKHVLMQTINTVMEEVEYYDKTLIGYVSTVLIIDYCGLD